jgi:hypothetical protein
VQQDLPSSRVGEDFRLRRRLNNSREKYGLYFLAKRNVWDKSGGQNDVRCANEGGWHGQEVGPRHLCSFAPRGHSCSFLSLAAFFRVKN